VVETTRPGTAVEFGDQVPGGGEHDRVEPGCSVGNPTLNASCVVVAMSPT
jgi:hypothetical protein